MTLPDYAIVAGISHYPDPGLGALAGPENDAVAFYRWVTRKAGVKRANAKLILSSDYKPRAKTAIDAMPSHSEIEKAFHRLHAASQRKFQRNKGTTIGRRLYIFVAGHGFVPRWEERVLALLTANASEGAPFHVAAPLYQRWARDSAAFEEVLLFMDCCGTTGRETNLQTHIFEVPKNPTVTGRLFYAAACKPGFKTREKTILDDKKRARGVFSVCLLEALNGLAAEGNTITNLSLARFLTEQLRRYLDPADLEDEEISQKADVDFDPKGTPFVLFSDVRRRSTLAEFSFHFAPANVNRSYVIDLGLDPLIAGTVPGPLLKLKLRPGMYVLRIDDREIPFDVPGRGKLHV